MSLKPWLVAAVCLWPALAQDLPDEETLHYGIEWRLITAGRATLKWTSLPNDGFEVSVHLESAGLVSKLYRVDDNYFANVSRAMCVQNSQMTAREGSRDRETKITYDYSSRKADYLEMDRVKNRVVLANETEIPACTHDVVGGIYYLRTLSLQPGQNTQIAVSDGKKSVMAKVEAQAREDVKTPAGTFKTIRYEVFLFDNVLYRRSGHLEIWMTDDRRRIPVQIRARMAITIGTITFQLDRHE
jgi:hypothetical protein